MKKCTECSKTIESGSRCKFCSCFKRTNNNNAQEAAMKTITSSLSLSSSNNISQEASMKLISSAKAVLASKNKTQEVSVDKSLSSKEFLAHVLAHVIRDLQERTIPLIVGMRLSDEDEVIDEDSLLFDIMCDVRNDFDNRGVSLIQEHPLLSNEELAMDSARLWHPESSFGLVNKQKEYCLESEDEMSFEEMTGCATHTAEYLEQRDRVYEDNTAFARSVIEANSVYVAQNGIDLANMSDDAIQIVAQQVLDIQDFPNSNKSSSENTVEVRVQRKSLTTGNWFNVKDIDVISFDITDVFKIDDNGNIIDFIYMADSVYDAKTKKMVETLSPTISLAMKARGILESYISTFTNYETGEFQVNVTEQRFIVSCDAFSCTTKLGDEVLGSVVAPFFNGVDLDGNVVNAPTFYSYDAMIDMDNSIMVLPTSMDESHGDVGSRLFNQGILTGTCVATRSMMMDDMLKQECAERTYEDFKLLTIERKTKTYGNFKKHKIQQRNAEILNTEIGQLAHELIEDSYIMDADVQKSIVTTLKANEDRLSELKTAIVAYRSVHGKGLNYSVYKVLDAMMRNNGRKEVAAAVKGSVLENIKALNTTPDLKLVIKRLSNQEIIEVYETAVEFRKKNPACNLNLNVAKEMKLLYAQIKGIKVSDAKVGNSSVRNIKVTVA